MLKCKLYSFFWPVIPGEKWKNLFLHHLENCPYCQQKFASREEVRRLLLLPGDEPNLNISWEAVQLALSSDIKVEPKKLALTRKTAIRFPLILPLWVKGKWKLAAGLAGLLLVAASILFRFQPWKKLAEPVATEAVFQVFNFQAYGQPTSPIIYKPYGSDFIFIWVERPKNGPIHEGNQ